MSVFTPASIKIRDLLGLTARGQTTMANSIPVAVASNQSALPVSDNGGSLTVDGTVAVTDGGGSLTVDGTVAVSNNFLTDAQLRATPVPVSGALTDAELRAAPIPVDTGRSYTYAAFRYWTVISEAITSENGNGVATPITYYYTYDSAQLGNTAAMTQLKNLADIQAVFGNVGITTNPFYIWIPFGAEGFARFSAIFQSSLDATLTIDVFGVTHGGALWFGGVHPLAIDDGFYSKLFGTIALTPPSIERFGLSLGDEACPYLILKVTPSADPTTGSWMLSFAMTK